jgi:hypothetical protein
MACAGLCRNKQFCKCFSPSRRGAQGEFAREFDLVLPGWRAKQLFVAERFEFLTSALEDLANFGDLVNVVASLGGGAQGFL